MSQQDQYQKAKALRAAAKQSNQPRTVDIDEVHNIVAGALYDFSSYLSVQTTPLTIGMFYDPTDLIKLLETFFNQRLLDTSNPRLLFWQDIIRK